MQNILTRSFLAACFGSIAMIAAVGAQATVLYDNGRPGNLNKSTAEQSDFDPVDGTSTGWQAGDDFVLIQLEPVVQDFHWWGIYVGSGAIPVMDDFSVRIFEEDQANPGFFDDDWEYDYSGSDLNLVRSPTSDLLLGVFPIFKYETTVPDTILSSNTNYLLSVVNDTTGSAKTWFWVTSGLGVGAGDAVRRPGDGTSWELIANGTPPNEETAALSFFVTGIPLPSVVALFPLGLALLTMFGRVRAGGTRCPVRLLATV